MRREIPINFKGPDVMAILEGRKTQARKVVKPQPMGGFRSFGDLPTCECHPHGFHDGERHFPSPYGKPGDHLWVLESIEARKDTTIDPAETMPIAAYSADGTHIWTKDRFREPWVWKSGKLPSICMPRRLSRITLEITDVRVERLQDISEEDALAEGFTKDVCGPVFRRSAGRAKQAFSRWLELPDGSEPDGYWCLDCIKKAARKLKARICGWNEWFEDDSAPYCNDCGKLLCHSLTEYGVKTELGLTDDKATIWPHLPVSGAQSLTLAELAEGMGDLQDEHLRRLAQVGFATLWDSIHGEGSWAANLWVWVVASKRIETAS